MIKTLTIDLETTGLDPWHDKILLIGYRYNSEGLVRQVRLYDREKPDETFIQALADVQVVKRGHNVIFDILCLRIAGYDVQGPIDDTRILAYLQDPQQELDLKTLVEHKLNRKVVRMEDFGRVRLKKNMLQKHPYLCNKLVKSGKYWVSKRSLEKYNIADVVNCDDLKRELITTKWYSEVEQPLSGILFDAEVRGIQLDIPYLKELNYDFEEKIQEFKKTFKNGFNPASPQQVKEAFKEEGLSLETTDRHTLKKIVWTEPTSIRGRLAANLLEFRKFFKLSGTYVKQFLLVSDDNGRLHGRFNQAGRENTSSGDIKGTATGRLSSSDPNLQNIPSRTEEGRKIRRAIIATPGMVLIDSDLKQIEPRLIAHYSQSKVLLNAYERNLDTHAIMGGLIFNKSPENLTKLERFVGKTSWLATVYGCWYKKLRLIVESNSEEPIFYDDEFYKKIQDSFWRANPEIRAWRTSHIQTVKNTGTVETIGGRTIKLNRSLLNNFYQDSTFEREAVNYLIQGSAADIMKMILVKLHKIWKGKLLATCHDEILAEDYVDSSGVLHNTMISSVKLNNVNLDADTKVINSWSEK